MANKRRRGNAWAYTIRRAGLLPKPLYLTFDDEAEGDEYVRRLEAQLDRGHVPLELQEPTGRLVTLRNHAHRYTQDQHVSPSDRRCLRVVLDRLPSRLELHTLTFAWARAWVSSMKREANHSPSTIRHHVGALARCLDWLTSSGDIPFNPLRLLPKGYATYTPEDRRQVEANDGRAKASTERDRRLEASEEKRIREILAGEKPDDKQRALELPNREALVMLFDLALESAMRLAEMYTLERTQIDLARRTVFLEKTKNGSKRQVPLSSVALGKLEAFLDAGDGRRVFPWWDGEHNEASLRRTTSRLSRQFSRIFAAAGCADLVFHDLRHEATSRLFERTNLSDLEIAKVTGHKDMRSLMRYANLRASTMAERLW